MKTHRTSDRAATHHNLLALLSGLILRRAGGVALSVALVTLSATLAFSSPPCDTPLIVQQGGSAPNVLIVLDSSGSMRETIYHDNFDPNIVYSGSFDEDTFYSVSSPGTFSPASFDSTFTPGPDAPLNTSGSGNGRFWGRYLNWLFYHASDLERSEQPQTHRMEVGKAAIQAIINSGSGLRYGLMRFNGEIGGTLVSPVGTAASTVASAAGAINPGGYTPSAEALVDAIAYFQTSDASAPIQSECQQNFIIFITDGYPTRDLNVPAWIGDQDGDGNEPGDCSTIQAPEPISANCSDYMDDVSYYLANTDMRSDLAGDQFVNTYTIGFGVDVPLLQETADNGGGTYQFAWDLQSLVASMGTVVGSIVQRISSGTAVAVVSTQAEGESRLFQGKFIPGLWRGYLEAYDTPFDPASNPIWEAGSILASRAANDRVIFTSMGGVMTDFVPSNSDVFAQSIVPWYCSTDVDGDGDVDTDDCTGDVDGDGDADAVDDSLTTAALVESDNIVRYVLGEDINGYRDRQGWKLGDMVYSTPLVVGAPSYFFMDPDYQQYIIDQASRERMVYVGANDGMLHAFRSTDGHELWGYVPEYTMNKLYTLTDPAYCHQSFVDLSPKAFDVKLSGTWRTVLIGGMRTGGDSYFALDITDPYSPVVLWETSIPEIYSSFTEPAIIHKSNASYLWVGSGADPSGDAHVGVLDLETGAVVATTLVSQTPGLLNMASGAISYDRDLNGTHDVLYHGDLAGSLWGWDISDDNPANWTAVEIYAGDQPIQARPTLTQDYNGDILVYFGTGQFLETADVDNLDVQGIYCIRDAGQTSAATRSDLLAQDGTIEDDQTSSGWYMDLTQATGERVTQPATIIAGVLYFTTFQPTNSTCSSGGYSWLYAVDYRDGSRPPDEDGNATTGTDHISSLGDGIASRPVVSLADATMIVQTSDARLVVEDLIIAPEAIRVRSWRQNFDAAAAMIPQP